MNRSAIRFRNVSLSDFVISFVPFALGLASALIIPSVSENPNHGRVIFTIWLSTALLIPGLCFYVLQEKNDKRQQLAFLFITFSYLAYMVHFYFATFKLFGGITGIFSNMRLEIATINVVIAVWWTIDSMLIWFGPRHSAWLNLARNLFYAFLFLVFVATDLFLRPGIIRYLGIALLTSVLISLWIALHRRPRVAADCGRQKAGNSTETRGMRGARMGFTIVMFIVAMIIAHVGAEVSSSLDANSVTFHPGVAVHSVAYYRAIYTIWASAILLTPALCAYALTRPGNTNSYWKGFWTVAFLALLVHLYWTIVAIFHGDFNVILHSRVGESSDPERVVEHRYRPASSVNGSSAVTP